MPNLPFCFALLTTSVQDFITHPALKQKIPELFVIVTGHKQLLSGCGHLVRLKIKFHCAQFVVEACQEFSDKPKQYLGLSIQLSRDLSVQSHEHNELFCSAKVNVWDQQ